MDEGRTFVEGPGGAWRELPAGTMVGDYRVEGLLGRGGMGAVYVAEHTRMGKRFALKVLPPELGGDRRFRERFDEEARRMASLEHPHIVTIHYAGESGGLHYFAMELLDGDLEEKRKAETGKLKETEVREILRQVLEALVYAHGKGIIHRDLKPANILLKRGGAEPVVKIADFGLAQVLGEDYMQSVVVRTIAASLLPPASSSPERSEVPPQRDSSSSPSSSSSSSSSSPHNDPTIIESRAASGAPRGSGSAASPGLAGTIDFMAPEVREGHTPDARADLYAVGVIGYSLLTGRKPLGKYKDASRLVPGLDPAWDDWLDALMAPDPAERTADAASALATLPNPAAGAPRSEDVQKERRALAADGKSTADRSAADGRDEVEDAGSGRSAAKARGSFRWVVAAVLLLAAAAGAWWVGVPPSGGPVAEAGNLEVRLQNEELRRGAGVTVKVDGREQSGAWREGVLKVEGLEVGRRSVEVSHPSYRTDQTDLTVTDQRTTTHEVRLDPLPGRITLAVSGPRAGEWSVEVGGEAMRPASGNVLELPAQREHEVRVSAQGWEAAEKRVTLGAAEERRLSFPLEEARGPVPGEDAEVELPGGVKMSFTWVRAMNLWVGTYEVTNAEFRAFRRRHDSGSVSSGSLNGPRQPVVRVSYEDAVAFCDWLTEREGAAGRLPAGYRYRLASGDEWTRFARCGTNREFPWGDSMPPTRGNYSNRISDYDSGAGRTVNVEDAGENEWGLYGVGGNVWEWTSEQRGSSRVVRGASWLNFGEINLRVESRRSRLPSYRSIGIGFRVLVGPAAGGG